MSTDGQQQHPTRGPLANALSRARLFKRRTSSTPPDERDRNDERVRAVEGVITLLDQNRPQDAVRAFSIAWTRHGAPPDEDLREWLIGTCGTARLGKLIQAYSIEPCPCCRSGLDACVECGGHGHIDHESICEDCLGFGVVPCSFCGGSGWLTLEAVPRPLRAAVMLERAELAVAHIKRLRDEAATDQPDDDPARVLKRCAHAAARLNGLIAVLENEVAASAELHWWSTRSQQQRQATVRSWIELANTVEQDIHALFARMSEAARVMVACALPGSARHLLATSRREAFESLKRPGSFAHTCFDHATLSRIAAGLSGDTDDSSVNTATSRGVAKCPSAPERHDGAPS